MFHYCRFKYKNVLFLIFRSDMYDFSFGSYRLFLHDFYLLFGSYACQFRVNHDTSAIFANNDFLTGADIQLSLGRNFVEATATGVALYIYDTQPVA